ncbi:CoA-binding protein [Amphibacillus cookii]|uniref:CoA-binding protein n=1 Tax=Amphibacillus cookii TaxID=767787 RepID=UPI00195C3AFE|nr:CoA-binding protein [Amphibacillus cookii]MBM7540793.1 putative CoA-binding protein [Amphibacillus cookii]
MSYSHPNQERLKEIFNQTTTIAVVGLSDQPNRISYQVSQVMQKVGFKIIPVNPNIQSSLGEKAYRHLSEIPEPVDIVNVFRKSLFLKDIAKETVQIGAKVLWAQQGVVDEAVYELYNKDLFIVMDSCIKVAYHHHG